MGEFMVGVVAYTIVFSVVSMFFFFVSKVTQDDICERTVADRVVEGFFKTLVFCVEALCIGVIGFAVSFLFIWATGVIANG